MTTTPSSLSWGVKLETRKRHDGRASDLQLRPVRCSLGVLKTAIGSARFQLGFTSALAGVHRTTEADHHRRFTSIARGAVLVHVRPTFGTITAKERYLESCVSAVLDGILDLRRLARTQTMIVLQPEDDRGGLLSCLINAAMCALLDAGLPCTGTVMSVALARKKNRDGSLYVLDPELSELTGPDATCDPSTYKAYTLDIHRGTLIQAAPESLATAAWGGMPVLPEGEQQEQLEVDRTNDVVVDVELLNAADAGCRLLADVVRRVLTARLEKLVVTTIAANNFMEVDEKKPKQFP